MTHVCTAGIYLTMRALLSPGDHVVVSYPGYQSLYEVMGCSGRGLWGPDLGVTGQPHPHLDPTSTPTSTPPQPLPGPYLNPNPTPTPPQPHLTPA